MQLDLVSIEDGRLEDHLHWCPYSLCSVTTLEKFVAVLSTKKTANHLQ